MVRRRSGQCQFGGTRGFLALAQGSDQAVVPLLVLRQSLLRFVQRGGKIGQGGRGIAGQKIGIGAILLDPVRLPVEIGKPLLHRLELAFQRCHAMGMRVGIVPPVGHLLPRHGKRLRRGPLFALGDIRLVPVGFDERIGLACRNLGGIGRGCRFPPSREQEACLEQFDAARQRPVPFGLTRLPLERRDPAVEPGHQVFETSEIGLGLAQLGFRVAAADMQPGDAGRLFEHLAPFGRSGRDDLRDLALADEGGGVRTGRRIREQQGDVLGPYVVSVQAVGAARAALDPAHDFDLASFHLARQHDFGEIARRASGGSCEYDVVHPPAAHGFRRVLAHDPADRLEQVRLAAAVGSDDAGQSRLDVERGRFDEGFETGQAQLFEDHRRAGPRPLRVTARRRPAIAALSRPR